MLYPAYSARHRGGGPSVPVNLTPPVLAGTVGIGLALSLTAGTWTGSPVLTYTLLRDGVAIGGLTGVAKAVLDAYLAALTALDIGPELDVVEDDSVSATNALSNMLVYNDQVRLPNHGFAVASEGITTVSGDTDTWATTYGGVLGLTLAAIAAGNRPDFLATGGVGGRPKVRTVAANSDAMKVTYTRGSSHVTWELIAVGRRDAWTAAARIVTYESTAGTLRYGIVSQSAAVLSWYNPSNNASTTTDPDTVDAIWSGDCDSVSGVRNIRKSGTIEGTSTGATTSKVDGENLTLGARTSGLDPVSFSYQAWGVGPQMTATERAEAFALLTYLTGIS